MASPAFTCVCTKKAVLSVWYKKPGHYPASDTEICHNKLLLIVQDTVYSPFCKSVKINFTFDLIFYVYEDSEKIGSHFFLCSKSKMAA